MLQIDNKKISLDSAQAKVFNQLKNLAKHISKLSQKNQTRLMIKAKIKSFFFKSESLKNLYIYGQVGRGKSMLMRHFFENLTLSQKIYFHFNSFMQQIHKELHSLRKDQDYGSGSNQNLIARATKKVIGDSRIICFDEMQVEDVADAMILREVFSYFIINKIAVVTTSNCHPLQLYENGLQRNLFLQFVEEIILKNFLVLNLDGKIDYRSQFISSKQHYFYPNNSENKKAILDIWLQVTENMTPQSTEIKVLGRKIMVKNSLNKIALFDFKELCAEDLGVADYQAICQKFTLIFLFNLPILKPEDRNEAKRLMWFIDEVYENKVDLLVLADCKPEEIYVKGIGAKAFKRAASRLNETM